MSRATRNLLRALTDQFIRNPFRVLWVINIFVFEYLYARVYMYSCSWPVTGKSGKDIRIALIGDPQLTDAYSYRQNGLLLYLTQFYSDVFMKRNFKLLNYIYKPDYVLILGDIMDGGREWRDEQHPDYFDPELKRLKHIFLLPQVEDKMIYMAGNHDIGFGPQIIPQAYKRHQHHFGDPNFSLSIANHTFIALDTLSYSGENESPYFQKADKFLRDFVATDPATQPRILLTHIPLFRPDNSPCGPLRNKPLIRQGRGYQYQNLVVESLSEHILQSVKPVLVLSGDDHDDCVYTHTSKSLTVPEHSIATFSWLQGNIYPGFALLAVNSDVSGVRDESAHQIGKCSLPPQLLIYKWYIWFLVITLVGCFGMAVWNRGKRFTRDLVAESKKNDGDARRGVHKDNVGAVSLVLKVVGLGVLYFGEVLGAAIAVYAVLLTYDWL
ncbi:Metallo-dependent phosphatase [Rhizoclosmatium globosum]|uniref:Metallo-dependent phosphatase n=1 Tax=Rhizoclosmatium globosum TaxID=329046 RepID=A0A1Y2CK48_9FUNG|nr:Metallo-dependent phosphatase [Rhizoclosmatium globosum]|eukprot:ORY47382.1 Metallo-dependent phosphatase [Rhizoclosmatium globosum]